MGIIKFSSYWLCSVSVQCLRLFRTPDIIQTNQYGRLGILLSYAAYLFTDRTIWFSDERRVQRLSNLRHEKNSIINLAIRFFLPYATSSSLLRCFA